MNYKLIVSEHHKKNSQSIRPNPEDFEKLEIYDTSNLDLISKYQIGTYKYVQAFLIKIDGVKDLSEVIENISYNWGPNDMFNWDNKIIKVISNKNSLMIPFSYDYKFINWPCYTHACIKIIWKIKKYENFLFYKSFDDRDRDLSFRHKYRTKFYFKDYIVIDTIQFKNEGEFIFSNKFNFMYIYDISLITSEPIEITLTCKDQVIPFNLYLNEKIIKKQTLLKYKIVDHENVEPWVYSFENLYQFMPIRCDKNSFIIKFKNFTEKNTSVNMVTSILNEWDIGGGMIGPAYA